MTLAGVDGCRSGWFVVTDTDGALAWHVVADMDAVLDLRVDTVGIDIPIGLLEQGTRLCDAAARRALAPRRAASVFSAPIRPALGAATHAEASDARARVEGKRMSIQAYHLLPKIHEVDQALRARPEVAERVFEAHPEVSFARMSGGVPLAHSKKTADGRAERLALLAPAFGDAPARFVAERVKKDVAADDVLDAFACLWTARRLAAGTAEALPETPDGGVPRDRFGLPMAIRV